MNQAQESQVTIKQASGWHGSLNLVYTKHHSKTQLAHALATAPLKIQRPFYPEGKGVCHSVIVHTAGGMVGGDYLTQNIHLQPNTNALITTAAAGKIYRSQQQQVKQTIKLQVDTGACLEWLPQETIVFNGAIYQQDLQIELAPEASWLGWEITRFGRSARGEKFLQGDWQSNTEIWREGQPIWIDKQWLPGSEDTFHSPHGLAGKPIVASLVWIGKPIEQEIIKKVRNLWNAKEKQGEAGVSQIQGQGLLCRYRGSSTTEVRNWFIEVWHFLRLSCLQRSAIKPRIWLI